MMYQFDVMIVNYKIIPLLGKCLCVATGTYNTTITYLWACVILLHKIDTAIVVFGTSILHKFSRKIIVKI
jgi:hypothetical protein